MYWNVSLPTPSKAGNAAEDYSRSLRSVASRLRDRHIHAASEMHKMLPLSDEEIQGVVEGSQKKASAFSSEHEFIAMPEDVDGFYTLTIQTLVEGLLERAQRFQDQGKMFEATYLFQILIIFGWHLKNEQQKLVQCLAGIVTGFAGWESLRSFYRRQGLVEQALTCQSYVDEECRKFEAMIQKSQRIRLDREFAKLVLRQDEAAMWRRYTALFLGAHPDEANSGQLPLLEQAAQQDPDEDVRRIAGRWTNRLRHETAA